MGSLSLAVLLEPVDWGFAPVPVVPSHVEELASHRMICLVRTWEGPGLSALPRGNDFPLIFYGGHCPGNVTQGFLTLAMISAILFKSKRKRVEPLLYIGLKFEF